MSKTQSNPKPANSEKELGAFYFPLCGFNCEAESLEEAQKLLQTYLENQK